VIESYMQDLEVTRMAAGESPVKQLAAIIASIAEDCGNETTSKFFPELWALSNHDPYAEQCMEALYLRARSIYVELIPKINPSLSEENCTRVALFLSASVEGLVPFVGHGKPFNRDIPAITNIAIKSLIDMVTTITDEDIDR